MLQHKQTIAPYHHNFSIIILLSLLFGVFLTACNNLRNAPLLPTATATLPTVTKPAPTAKVIATQTEILIPTPIPAKNGWTSEYTATVPSMSVNQYTQEQIASLLFTQWLNHFKTEDADSRNRLDEYELLKVEIPKNLSFLAQEKAVDFVATVVFSVKPSVYMYSDWNAGNGISTDNIWIRNKFLIIGIDKKNELYNLLLIGTGP
jgi:hypothetical protein